MTARITKYMAGLLLVALVSGCANVRWSHPAPSSALVQEVAKDIYGIKYEKAYTDNTEEQATPEAFRDIMLSTPDESTRGVGLVTRLENDNFYMSGYSTHLHRLGLNSADDYARYNIPEKPAFGFKYWYEGKITGLAFQVPHMVMSSDARTSMMMRTDVVTPYKIMLFYTDHTTAVFDFLSSTVSTRFGGGFKRNKHSYFDGWLDVNHDFYSDTFTVTGPFHR